MVLKGFSPTGSHIGQFRQHRDLGNVTGNKGRRGLPIVGKPGLFAIVKRQQVVSQRRPAPAPVRANLAKWLGVPELVALRQDAIKRLLACGKIHLTAARRSLRR